MECSYTKLSSKRFFFFSLFIVEDAKGSNQEWNSRKLSNRLFLTRPINLLMAKVPLPPRETDKENSKFGQEDAIIEKEFAEIFGDVPIIAKEDEFLRKITC